MASKAHFVRDNASVSQAVSPPQDKSFSEILVCVIHCRATKEIYPKFSLNPDIPLPKGHPSLQNSKKFAKHSVRGTLAEDHESQVTH